MRIEELLPGQKVTLAVNINGQLLEFESIVLDSYLNKRYIILEPIMVNGKAISFRGNGVIVNLLATIGNEKPHLFRNVTIHLQKKFDGTLCYQVSTMSESVLYNRRDNFRCFVGVRSSVQGGANRAAHHTIIKDISYTGFSVICDPETDFDSKHVLHTVLRDRIEDLEENYVFHLYGVIARTQELDNGKILYGCRLTDRVPGLDKYIMAKERIRLRRTNGGNL